MQRNSLTHWQQELPHLTTVKDSVRCVGSRGIRTDICKAVHDMHCSKWRRVLTLPLISWSSGR